VVDVDTQGPQTTALTKLRVRQGRATKFKFLVSDLTPKAHVTIALFKNGQRVRRLAVGNRPTGTNAAFVWTCNLHRGTYRWVVNAVDQAGNRQTKAGSNTLIVT